MQKQKMASIIVIAIALLFHLIGVILLGLADNFATFNVIPMANSFRDIGLFTAILAGAVLVAIIIIGIVKGSFNKEEK
ncbi:MAG: hypothetical protein FWE13_04505 [Firmicutes bacterium]|nr:hypothetical protein [Bacillota bacterium]